MSHKVDEDVEEHEREDNCIFTGSNLVEAIDYAERKLAEGCKRLFQRDTMLVRIGHQPRTEEVAHIKRHKGAAMFFPVDATWLLEKIAEHGLWYKESPKGGLYRVNPPKQIASHIIARAGEWKDFDVVSSIMRTPTILSNGDVIEKPGYDVRSQIFFDFKDGEFGKVPKMPTRKDAKIAEELLYGLVEDFPFVSGEDCAVWLSAVLCSVLRPIMRTCPLHGFSAPNAGTGKTLLAQLVGIISTGALPTTITLGMNDEEAEKRVDSILFQGDPCVNLDNLDRPLRGDKLCMLMTQETVAIRVLGQTNSTHCSTKMMWLATGNNLRVHGDMTRRVTICYLDAKMEHPEDRGPFKIDPLETAARRRSDYVRAALTIIKAWHEAGAPTVFDGYDVKKEGAGSFDDWVRVRAALMWLGWPDPIGNRDRVAEDNPFLDEREELLQLWRKAITPGDYKRLREIACEATSEWPNKKVLSLYKFLCERVNGKWNEATVGRVLGRHRDAVSNGYVLKFKGRKWGVENLEKLKS